MKSAPHPDKTKLLNLVKLSVGEEVSVVDLMHFATLNNLIEIPAKEFTPTDDNSGIWFQFGEYPPSIYYVGYLKRRILLALRCRTNLTLSHRNGLFLKELPRKVA